MNSRNPRSNKKAPVYTIKPITVEIDSEDLKTGLGAIVFVLTILGVFFIGKALGL